MVKYDLILRYKARVNTLGASSFSQNALLSSVTACVLALIWFSQGPQAALGNNCKRPKHELLRAFLNKAITILTYNS